VVGTRRAASTMTAMDEPDEHREAVSVRLIVKSVRRRSSLALRSMGVALGIKPDGTPAWTKTWIARRLLAFGVVIALMLTVIWAMTPVGYFWPGWIFFVVLLPPVASWSVRRALRTNLRRPLAIHAAVSLDISGALVVIWLLSSHRNFWPIWPMLGLAVVFAVHALFVPGSSRRERALAERVDVLTRTRKGALDVQVAETRRVERDLHDGAQARLVSLGMSLGMADELLDSDPAEARRLLAEARSAAGDALGDLRALVKGIMPPVLADRGLGGAIHALVVASPIPVEVTMELPAERLPAPVESAAYFAVAEALANVIKHSGAGFAWVVVTQGNNLLSMTVGDNGAGGVDPDQGSGLRGIERRLDAFDGTMQISSPPGGPTVVTMEVPCEPSSPKT
jgi:signal transduction histidine kinase